MYAWARPTWYAAKWLIRIYFGAKSFLSTWNELSKSIDASHNAHSLISVGQLFGLVTTLRWRRFRRQSVLFGDVVSSSRWTWLCPVFWLQSSQSPPNKPHARSLLVLALLKAPLAGPENQWSALQLAEMPLRALSTDRRNPLLFLISFPTTETNAVCDVSVTVVGNASRSFEIPTAFCNQWRQKFRTILTSRRVPETV